jgi:hypothetical protein
MQAAWSGAINAFLAPSVDARVSNTTVLNQALASSGLWLPCVTELLVNDAALQDFLANTLQVLLHLKMHERIASSLCSQTCPLTLLTMALCKPVTLLIKYKLNAGWMLTSRASNHASAKKVQAGLKEHSCNARSR